MKVELNKIYIHYKGGFYLPKAIAKHTETEEDLVIYEDFKSHNLWARPLKMWCEDVNGRPRFRIATDQEIQSIPNNSNQLISI